MDKMHRMGKPHLQSCSSSMGTGAPTCASALRTLCHQTGQEIGTKVASRVVGLVGNKILRELMYGFESTF